MPKPEPPEAPIAEGARRPLKGLEPSGTTGAVADTEGAQVLDLSLSLPCPASAGEWSLGVADRQDGTRAMKLSCLVLGRLSFL